MLPLLIVGGGVLAVVLVLLAVTIYRASHGAPQFYAQALEVPLDQAEAAAEEFLQQATALASDVQVREHWHAAFTEEQINGWLTVDLPKNYGEVLPAEISQPRIQLRQQEATLACRWKTAGLDTVVSLVVDVFVTRPDEIAIRFRRAAIGDLPVPLGQMLHHIEAAAAKLSVPTVWRQQEGDPVVVLLLHEAESASEDQSTLRAIELRDGVLLLAGGEASPVVRTATRVNENNRGE